MKEVKLTVRMDDNEAFDKEVTDLIRSKVREIARNEQAKIITEAAHEELGRILNTSGYRSKVVNIVSSATYEAISKAINEIDLKALVEEKINDRVENRMGYYLETIEKKCKETLESTINSEVKKKLANLLG